MEKFKSHIQEFINGRVASDELFAETFRKSTRTIDDCIKYILNWVNASNRNVVAKEEIYSQVIHFYQENLDPGKNINAHVTCATRVELTEDEKAEQKSLALKRFQDEEFRKLQSQNQRTKKPQKTSAETSQSGQSLFDF